jgi:hypothetical protein
VHRSKISLSMSHLASSADRSVPAPQRGLQRRGSLRRCRPTLKAGARDMEKSPRARSPRCRAIAKQSGRPVSRLGSLRRCRATLQAGAGVNTRAEGEYPQFLDAFCLGLKEFGSARFCAGACDQRRIDRADWRGHGHYGRIMTTELEPPAPLPIHSRAGWFNAGHTSGAIFAAKLMQSAEPLSQLEQKMDAYEFFHQIVEPNCENALRPRIILG